MRAGRMQSAARSADHRSRAEFIRPGAFVFIGRMNSALQEFPTQVWEEPLLDGYHHAYRIESEAGIFEGGFKLI